MHHRIVDCCIFWYIEAPVRLAIAHRTQTNPYVGLARLEDGNVTLQLQKLIDCGKKQYLVVN
jgi:hypothetical protein